MSEIETLTVALPIELAAEVKGAVRSGDYASSSEVVQAALRDWTLKRAAQAEEATALKADIDAGLADVAARRVRDFDVARIIGHGRRRLSAARSSSG